MAGAPEQQLAICMAGTREHRERLQGRIADLTRAVDWPAFLRVIEQGSATALVGHRLMAVPDIDVPGFVASRVAEVHAHNRLRVTLVETETQRLWRLLENAGIPCVALKGPLMAHALYGDAALRPSNDVDLLVAAHRFAAATEIVASAGYVPIKGITWRNGLPLFETTLESRDAWRPPVDLHWRVHWYERASSGTLLRASAPDDGSPRRLGGPEQFAALLLFFCRDGLRGLRGIADISAAWDACRDELDHGGLEPLAERHPELRPAFVAAIKAAERLAGVPAERILPSSQHSSRAVGRATRLASPNGAAGAEADQARIALVDVLLAPRGGTVDSVRRHLLPPAEAINRIYGVPTDAVARRTIARLRFAVLVGGRILPHMGRALWSTRAGRALVPPPV